VEAVTTVRPVVGRSGWVAPNGRAALAWSEPSTPTRTPRSRERMSADVTSSYILNLLSGFHRSRAMATTPQRKRHRQDLSYQWFLRYVESMSFVSRPRRDSVGGASRLGESSEVGQRLEGIDSVGVAHSLERVALDQWLVWKLELLARASVGDCRDGDVLIVNVPGRCFGPQLLPDPLAQPFVEYGPFG